MTKNIRYRGAVQSINEYQKDVVAHQVNADREYDGQYRGVNYHHDAGADVAYHAQTQHEVKVSYRGATGTALVG